MLFADDPAHGKYWLGKERSLINTLFLADYLTLTERRRQCDAGTVQRSGLFVVATRFGIWIVQPPYGAQATATRTRSNDTGPLERGDGPKGLADMMSSSAVFTPASGACTGRLAIEID